MAADLVAWVLLATLFGSAAILGEAKLLSFPVTATLLWAYLRWFHGTLAVEARVRPILAWSRAGVVALLAGLQGVAIASAHGTPVDEDGAGFVLLGIFLVILAAFLPRLPRNPWFGIRTGWTEKSERAWRSTHRVGAVSLAACGALVAVAGATHWVLGLVALVAGNLVNLVFVVIWSQRAWAADPEREPV